MSQRTNTNKLDRKIQFYFIFVNYILIMRIDQYLWCLRYFKSETKLALHANKIKSKLIMV